MVYLTQVEYGNRESTFIFSSDDGQYELRAWFATVVPESIHNLVEKITQATNYNNTEHSRKLWDLVIKQSIRHEYDHEPPIDFGKTLI